MNRCKTVFECYSILKIAHLGQKKKQFISWAHALPKLGTSFGFLGLLEFGFYSPARRLNTYVLFVCLSLSLSVCHQFCNFQKERFVGPITTCLIQASLYCLIHFSNMLLWRSKLQIRVVQLHEYNQKQFLNHTLGPKITN